MYESEITCIWAPWKSITPSIPCGGVLPFPDLTVPLQRRGAAHSSLFSYEEINVRYFLSRERGVSKWKCY